MNPTDKNSNDNMIVCSQKYKKASKKKTYVYEILYQLNN